MMMTPFKEGGGVGRLGCGPSQPPPPPFFSACCVRCAHPHQHPLLRALHILIYSIVFFFFFCLWTINIADKKEIQNKREALCAPSPLLVRALLHLTPPPPLTHWEKGEVEANVGTGGALLAMASPMAFLATSAPSWKSVSQVAWGKYAVQPLKLMHQSPGV